MLVSGLPVAGYLLQVSCFKLQGIQCTGYLKRVAVSKDLLPWNL
jgi:hypothetical protein